MEGGEFNETTKKKKKKKIYMKSYFWSCFIERVALKMGFIQCIKTKMGILKVTFKIVVYIQYIVRMLHAVLL